MNSPDREELLRLTGEMKAKLESDRFWGLDAEKGKITLPAALATEPVMKKTKSLFETNTQTTPKEKLSKAERVKQLAQIATEVAACTKCRLCETRTNTVPGEGNPEPRILFIGEGPGATEDETGRPFVGRAGKLLTDIIEKGMQIPRASVFIANIVKCRPPENREPQPDEIAACMPYLQRQIEVLSPEIIITLGRPATSTMLETKESIGQLRGRIQIKDGQKIMPTFHPAYLLRNPPEKKKTWEDIQVAMRELGLPSLPKAT